MRPGVDVISRALPPPRSAPTDTGVAFMVGATNTGGAVELCRSMTEYIATCGDRPLAEPAYDAADAYFHEGGNMLYVGNTAAAGTLSVQTTGSSKAAKAAADEEPQINPLAAADPGIAAALTALTKDLGPGQVFIADATLAADASNQGALLAHAEATNRVALLSCADGDAAVLTAAGTAVQAVAAGRYGALFAPSATIPGLASGTTRSVPYAAVEAGIIARNDVSFSPNQAAAGDLGQALYAIDVAGRFTDLEYQNLNEASVNMARVIYGGVRTYGYRSCVDPATTPQWEWFGWARLNMAIVAEAEAIGEHYVFTQLDGRGHTLAEFGGELSAMLAGYYEADSLYGATPEEAYAVDVGSSVNTPETIANGELHAVISVRMSPGAEWVVIEIVKVASNQALPGVAPAVAA